MIYATTIEVYLDTYYNVDTGIAE